MTRKSTENTDPTIYEILTQDHRTVSELLATLAAEDDVEACEDLFAEVMQELELHARAEEVVVYDLLAQHDETRALAERAQQEHLVVIRLLAEMDATEVDDERWDELVAELTRSVEDHVAAEEEELYTALQGLLDDDQARTLAETFEAMKNRLEEELESAAE